jgi:hypothetical protein
METFTAQAASDEDLIARGLLDENLNATPRGELFLDLTDAGIFDENGVITQKGRDYSVAERDIGKPENFDAFKTQWDEGIIRPETGPMDVAKGVLKFAGEVVSGLPERLQQEFLGTAYNMTTWGGFIGRDDNRPQWLKNEMTATGLGWADGLGESYGQLASMADVGRAWAKDDILKNRKFFPGDVGDEKAKEAERSLYQARQRQWQLQKNIQDLEAGEIAENVLGLDNAIQQAEVTKKALGKEKFDELYQGGSSASQIFTDASNVVPGLFAVKAATKAPVATRAILLAQQRIGRTAAMDMKIASMQTALAAGETLLKKEAVAGPRWATLATNLTARGALDDAAIAAGKASRLADDAARVRTTLPALTDELQKAMAQRASLATRIPEAVAQKAVQTMELGRAARALPANVMGATLERVGNGLTRTDKAITGFLKERGLDQLYTGAVGAAGMLGLAGNPVLGAVGIGAGVLKTGKMLEQAGKMFRYVGKEMAQARGQIPFWQRVAVHTAPGTANRALAHTFGMFELGGATTDILRRTGRGVLAAAPVDLAFEWLSDGADMRKQTVYQAFAESMVLGGSFAAAGGITMGTKARMRELGLNDEINFRQGLVDQKQKALFEAIPTESRRAVATYSIANPTLNFNFTNKGASHYDPPTNTATINVASSNPLKPLLGHEVLHHTIIKNGMESGIAALFLGDTETNTTGGLLRAKDGSLDPNFAEFVETYNRRMDNAGAPRPKLKDLAVEYFIEQHADHYSDMAESGALGATASRGAARRWMGGVMDTLLPRGAVLKDLHFKMGGAVDANGAMVMGNGLLADGIRQTPAAQKMFRDMNRRSAGRAPGQFEPLGTDSKDAGPTVQLDPENGIDIALMHPLVVVDENGVPVMQNGKPVFIDKATDMLRGAAGVTVMEKLRENQAAGKRYAPGEMHLDDNGEVQGRWLSPEVLRDVISKNKFNSEQAQVMRSVNAAIKTGDGSRMVVINFPATKKLKNGKVVYATQAATIRDIVPVGLSITKDGNLLIGLMSVTKLHENITKRAGSKRGKRLYGGNTDQILTDVRAMMDYHKQGVDSLEFFAKKYGAVEANERKLFINTMFGLLNKTEQAVLNPLLLEDGVKSQDNVFRTYRVDRVSKAVPMAPDQHQPMPFSYEAASAVKMPEMPEGPRMMPETADMDPERARQIKTQEELLAPELDDGAESIPIENPDDATIPGTIAPDSPLRSLPTTGTPIRWDQSNETSKRYLPESDRNAYQTMTPELLAQIEAETPTLAAIHIDRMKVGEYMGVDLQGGMFYPTIKENLANGVAWAFNSPGVARSVARRAAQNGGYVKLILMQEGNVVGNKTFGNIWFNNLNENIKARKISKGMALTQLNVARRVVYKKIEGKDAKRNPWVESHSKQWKTLEEARDAILSMPQIERGATYFQKSKTVTKADGEKISYGALLSQKMAASGFPDAIKIVGDIEEPAFKGVPTGAAVAILRFDPLSDDAKIQTAQEAGVPEHMSYGYVLKGQPVAKLSHYQVVDETFPKTKGQIMTQQHTDFPIKDSVPFKGASKGEIDFATADIRYLPEPLDGGGKNGGMVTPKINTPKEIKLMEQALAAPRDIPKDLREAWEIGKRVSHLSDSEAVYSGMVPEWVFNLGHDVTEFYEAGRRGENPEYVVGWRRGGIPERGRSVNWADNNAEPGVSLAYAHNRTDMELNAMTMLGVSHRKKTFVDGWAFPKSRWGSDGEIVTLGTKELKP